MKQVAITGASGSMGYAAYQEYLKKGASYSLAMLIRPSKKNLKRFKGELPDTVKPASVRAGQVTQKGSVKIVWGDIRNLADVRLLVEEADMVVNMAAIIPPAALRSKRATDAVNTGGVKNLLQAIEEKPNGKATTKLIYISSVAVYGDRLPPYHQIRVGDPVYPSIGDFYALTKVNSERLVIESGLRYWAVIRQTFISIPNLFSLMDPIMYLQPIQQCIEPITWRDAGYGVANLFEAPDAFWRNIYNMGGGPRYRIVYHEFLQKMFGIFGLNFYKCTQRNWFTLRNFHCGYFDPDDSQRLNAYTHHQRDSFDDYFELVRQATPKILGIARIVPAPLIKWFMKLYATPAKWAKHPEKYPKLFSAYYGSEQRYKSIPDWNNNMPVVGEAKPIELGYTRKPNGDYSIDDMRSLAAFRGGECLSSQFTDLYTPLKWKCSVCGCEFEATPMLVTDGGHFCPECQPPIWNYGEICKKNHFLAQVYYAQFDPAEKTVYTTAEILDERRTKD